MHCIGNFSRRWRRGWLTLPSILADVACYNAGNSMLAELAETGHVVWRSDHSFQQRVSYGTVALHLYCVRARSYRNYFS